MAGFLGSSNESAEQKVFITSLRGQSTPIDFNKRRSLHFVNSGNSQNSVSRSKGSSICRQNNSPQLQYNIDQYVPSACIGNSQWNTQNTTGSIESVHFDNSSLRTQRCPACSFHSLKEEDIRDIRNPPLRTLKSLLSQKNKQVNYTSANTNCSNYCVTDKMRKSRHSGKTGTSIFDTKIFENHQTIQSCEDQIRGSHNTRKYTDVHKDKKYKQPFVKGNNFYCEKCSWETIKPCKCNQFGTSKSCTKGEPSSDLSKNKYFCTHFNSSHKCTNSHRKDNHRSSLDEQHRRISSKNLESSNCNDLDSSDSFFDLEKVLNETQKQEESDFQVNIIYIIIILIFYGK